MAQDQNIEGKAKVTVDTNRLCAYIEVLPPEGDGEPFTIDKAKELIKKNEVVFGLLEDGIADAVMMKNWNEKILIAQGIEPRNGLPAKIEYKFPVADEKMAPKIDEQGNVDYYDLGLINNVRKGEAVAIRKPPAPGEDGTDVYGCPLPFKPGKDLVLPRGKNTVVDQDRLKLYAVIDGSVSLRSGKVTVEPVFNLKGNVDFTTGNIDFIGDVAIGGMVTHGFKVYAEGNIEIRGLIENAEVVAGGNIQVKGGITGNMNCVVKAGGSIQARFVENARLEAGDNIYIREAIMQAQVKAGGSVKVSDKKAIIVGGVIQAAREVESKVIGSQFATQTVVEVGINPMHREEYYTIMKEYEKKKRELAVISQSITRFQQSGRQIESLDDGKRSLLIRQLDEFKTFREQITDMEDRIAFLEEEFKHGEAAKVKVIDVVYPGVKITIGRSIYLVNDPIKSSSFILEGGDVRIGDLR